VGTSQTIVTSGPAGPGAGRQAAPDAVRPARLDAATGQPPARDATNRKNMMLLIELRWVAVLGQIATIAFAKYVLGIELPLLAMLAVLGVLVALNLVNLAWLRNRAEVGSPALLTVLILDVAALTAQLYLSGGATNPFIFLYLLQIMIAAVLLDAWSLGAVVALSFTSFVALTGYYRPLVLPSGDPHELFELHIVGMLVCFVLDAVLLMIFVILIMQNLRRRDARLAALRQRAMEEDHIVRLGLLASGAAHELGTPLALLAVVLSDWRRMPALSACPEMLEEIDEMQAAVQRCKSIVTGILLSSGEARGEAPTVTTLGAFLDGLAAEWRSSRCAALGYRNAFGSDPQIVADEALKQVIFNVLDNAYEVSPGSVTLDAERAQDALRLRVSDRGPGFAPQMLEQLGRPYQSSKGRPGGGLGLFLVVNVVRKLGGTVRARNLAEGGAEVTLELPLATLTLEPADHDR
jgi:two-component system, sensor histidine kinase RegB